MALVGTRRATVYGRQAAEELAGGLARNGVTVVSGLARGIDSIGHKTALAAGGRTVAVLACGLDMVYPPEHLRLAQEIMEQGALLSDYALGTQPRSEFFPRRNRIMVGLSLGVLVVEGDLKSGALITARQALDENREVFAVPGSIYSPTYRGANWLIQAGQAKLVTRVEDILEELNLTMAAHQMEAKELLPADETEAALLRLLSLEPIHIDEVRRESALPIATVSGALAMLELKGMVRLRIVVPGKGAHPQPVQRLQLRLRLDTIAGGKEGREGRALQARRLEVGRARLPGVLHGAEVPFQQREARPTDLRHAPKRHPVLELISIHWPVIIAHLCLKASRGSCQTRVCTYLPIIAKRLTDTDKSW